MQAFLFPGQGAQVIGMGRDLAETFPAAADVFAEVDAALGEKLSALIWDGDIADLTLTENAQPALMATSIAALRALESEGVRVTDAAFVAGHSLGEYSALCAAGSLDLADTARLLRLRGRAMQAAVPVGEGAMAALLGLDIAAAEAVAAEAAQGEVCEAANDNDPAQVVVSGQRAAAVERAVEIAKAHGAKRAMLLPVSAPFHCALMAPAAEAMRAALADVAIAAPAVPLVANVTAEAVTDPETIRRLLVEQVTGRVRWRESVQWMAAQGVTETVEIGAGKALSGMVRRIAKEVATRVGRRAGRRAGAGGTGSVSGMFDLSGKTALVTGASGGIGGAIARALHAQGARVALSGTRVAPLEALAAELGEGAVVLPCDLSDAEAVEALPKAATEALGGLDILVNNAGITRDQLMMRMSDADWASVIEVNLTSVMRLSRGVLARHDEGALGPDHQHQLDRRRDRQSGPGELRGGQGRRHRHVEEPRRRGREPGRHRQLHRAGLHHDGDDRRAERGSEGAAAGRHPGRPHGRGGRGRRGGGVSRVEGGRLHDRADAPCERRNGDDLMQRASSRST